MFCLEYAKFKLGGGSLKALSDYGKKVIEIEAIEKIFKIKSYEELCLLINKLLDEEKISPVKSSGGNGKKPTLYKKYRIIEEAVDNSLYLDEINYKLCTKFSIDYYINHLDKYKEHRQYILLLNDFFTRNEHLLSNRISINERSFQIWGREKFLQREGGKTILKNLGVDLGELNYYDTSEPLAYYSKSKEVPQTVLIIENKDTYYTMRRHLINGKDSILGVNISSLIYGGGKNIYKSSSDFKISVESHISDRRNSILYFGDIDYEGIIIYEGLYELLGREYNMKPFINGYKKMIEKAQESPFSMPITKEGQNRNISERFLSCFDEASRGIIENILKEDLYVPQEIININDF